MQDENERASKSRYGDTRRRIGRADFYRAVFGGAALCSRCGGRTVSVRAGRVRRGAGVRKRLPDERRFPRRFAPQKMRKNLQNRTVSG